MQNPSHSFATRSLHWLVAVTMLGLLGVGYYMVEFEAWPLYSIHKALGVLALLVILPRVIYRLRQGALTPKAQQTTQTDKLVAAAHWALLLGTLLMPISGMLYSGFGGYGIDVFGFTLVANNYTENGAVPFNETIFLVAKAAHSYIAYGLTALIFAHIAGALKHHLFDRDATLLRMLGKA